jgi:hypothetical protein
MDRVFHRIREKLRGAVADAPPPPPPSAPLADPVAEFRFRLEQAGGVFREFAGLAGVRAAFPDDDGETGMEWADLLIADTGTVVRTCATRESSRVSLVPPRTVFLATAAMIVPGWPEALARLALIHRAGTAYTVFVTGPSRTADVEKQLVIPAHGPREVIVALLPEIEEQHP